ncbi:PREDICTED: guanosine nucleotide diphosphate dissociation inhibitor 2-like [Brassica oleracea var. oleracea]|uniref:guanosine nucleotide diphosphate dissociation inhibitor 2-like n=1 Tax=Brassica oleracea var. oleracea TaxID=109376 RepID=UPI0006A6EEAF|nr:PREDICTED: guanosine nucleotide diphosphate dissociation inhibitor 2-like [Brassica oleracea var. oleracea]
MGPWKIQTPMSLIHYMSWLTNQTCEFLNDLWYVFCLYSHNVAAKGKFIAFVSTDAETENPQTELKAGIDLLCPVDEIFFYLYDRYKSLNVPSWGNCFISTSYDATAHFETTVAHLLNMYTLITKCSDILHYGCMLDAN